MRSFKTWYLVGERFKALSDIQKYSSRNQTRIKPNVKNSKELHRHAKWEASLEGQTGNHGKSRLFLKWQVDRKAKPFRNIYLIRK